VLAAVLDKLFDLLELHLVLQRPDLRSRIKTIADHRRVRECGQFIAHGFVHSVRDIDPFDREAHLAGVRHRTVEYLLCSRLHVHIVQHDRGIVAAEFQGKAFDGVCRARHDFLARGGRSSERHFGDVRVLGQASA